MKLALDRYLGDAPGLGKTPQTTQAAKELGIRSALTITPAAPSIKQAWATHWAEWAGVPASDVFIVNSTTQKIPKKPFLIVNYELITDKKRIIFNQLTKRRFDLCVMDEAQRLKSTTSKRTRQIIGTTEGLTRNSKRRWFLSGTPMPNRPIELYPILRQFAPEVIAPHLTLEQYAIYFCDGWIDDFGKLHAKGVSNETELRDRLKSFMILREVDDVYDQLPPVEERVIKIEIDAEPWLDDDESLDELPMATQRKVIGEAKIPYAVKYIKTWMRDNPNDKLMVFAYTREVVEQLTSQLRQFGASNIYGGTTANQKKQCVSNFVNNRKNRIIVAQINSAGEGIDGLQTVCNNGFFVEIDWSAGGWDQALGRLRRMKQTKAVKIAYLVAKDTLDQAIIGTYRKKKKILDFVMATNTHLMENENMSADYSEVLERIACALETLAGTGSSPKPKAKASTTEAKNPEPKTEKVSKKLNIDHVRKAAQLCFNALGGQGNPKAKTLLAKIREKFGVEKLEDLSEDQYGEAIASFHRLKEKADAKKATKTEADEE